MSKINKKIKMEITETSDPSRMHKDFWTHLLYRINVNVFTVRGLAVSIPTVYLVDQTNKANTVELQDSLFKHFIKSYLHELPITG